MSAATLAAVSVSAESSPVSDISNGRATLGIELGSTNIKAVLIGSDLQPIASGASNWESQYREHNWTYALADIHAGVKEAVAEMLAAAKRQYGIYPQRLAAVGVSAMMHGYLAFNSANELLTPFRTWRNTNTGAAAAELSDMLNFNFPLRWSASHLYQAILNNEKHLADIAFITTLAGYLHFQLTGQKVLGVGDASGMFPFDAETGDYDATRLTQFDALAAQHGFAKPLQTLLPEVLPAGAAAGTLTPAGAHYLDPTGTIAPGALVCPPEGDAGTGMVATNAVAPRTGNVSVGTSIFAMVVLEHPLLNSHPEIDLVTTPDGNPVAMIHCNNGASELAAWVGLFGEFARMLRAGNAYVAQPGDNANIVYEALLTAALPGDSAAGGLLAFNNLAGEPVTGLAAGRPMVVRAPDSTLNLANFMRAQVYSIFAALALGMRLLAAENVTVTSLAAHGGVFRTPIVAQRLLAAAVNAPVSVSDAAAQGGAWGIALLAAYAKARQSGDERDLPTWLNAEVFADSLVSVEYPQAIDVMGFATYLERYQAALPVQSAAIMTIG